MTGPLVEFIRCDDDHAFAIHRNVFFWASLGSVSSKEVAEATSIHNRILAEHPGIVWVIYTSEFSKPPMGDVRRSLGSLWSDTGEQMQGLCAVFESTGFFASVARSALTAMLTMSRLKFPHKILPSPEGFGQWLSGVAIDRDGPSNPATLQAALMEVRTTALDRSAHAKSS